jgi:hypothetical protein
MKPNLGIVSEETFEVTSLLVAAAAILLVFIASAIFIMWIRRKRKRP